MIPQLGKVYRDGKGGFMRPLRHYTKDEKTILYEARLNQELSGDIALYSYPPDWDWTPYEPASEEETATFESVINSQPGLLMDFLRKTYF